MLAVTSEAFGHRLFLYMLSLQTFGQLHFIMPVCLNRAVFNTSSVLTISKEWQRLVLCALYQFFDHGLKLRLLPRA